MAEEGQPKTKLHVWTIEEDALLINCLLDIREEGTLVADNGFKSGGLKQLERMINEKSPGCGIKAVPHIQSRLKTLKSNWQIVYDMVHGVNTSGFGWDPIKQCVTAEKTVWDEYIKSNKKAAQFRGKSFPHFDALCTIFGKDRASGKDSISNVDIVDEIRNTPDVEVDDNEEDLEIGIDMDPSMDDTDHPTQTTTATSGSRKRKRNSRDRDELMMESLEKMLQTTCQGIQEVSQSLGSRMDKLARASMLDAKREKLYDELLKVDGLTDNERQDALLKLVKDDELLVVFGRLPGNAKLALVRKLLA